MSCYPNEGILDSYSQIPIKFTCHPKCNNNFSHIVPEKMAAWARNYSLVKEELKNEHDDFKYSVLF